MLDRLKRFDILNNMSEECKSLSDLMQEAFMLSMTVGHSELSPDGHYFTWRDNLELLIGQTHADTVSAWADGLIQKYYHNVTTGHCSPNQMVKFNVERFEVEVKMNIKMMTDALKRIGHPIKLTFEEMRKRGYRGAWAGE